MTDLPVEQRRVLRDVRPSKPGCIELKGKQIVDFASNDYLGLSRHPALVDRSIQWVREYGVGSRASRLVSGNLDCLNTLEDKVARLKGTAAALVFGSGFQANSSILAALADRRLVNQGESIQVFTDRLCHASTHFGLSSAGIRQHRFRHNDLDHLEDLLKEKNLPNDRSLIVTESVFSMDGDRLNWTAMRELALRHDALLYVDEAHATGVFGKSGEGLVPGESGCHEIIVGTFGKALGCYGSYVACSGQVREYLINRCAGLVYSTGLPPMVLGAMDAALDLLPDLDESRAHLQRLAIRLRDELHSIGLDTLCSDTHIVPVVVKQDARVLEVARRLLQCGFLVAAIRPPTVPPGTARLRISLSSAHSQEQVMALIDAIGKIVPVEVNG